MWWYNTQMRLQDGNPCLLSVVPTLSIREPRHKNGDVNLLMKQVEFCKKLANFTSKVYYYS